MALQSNNVEAAEMKSDKRFRMYAQDFYCPLISGDHGRGKEQVLQCKPALISDVSESNDLASTSAESVHECDAVVVSDSTSSEDGRAGAQEINDDEADNASLLATGHLVETELVNDTKTEDVITAVDAPPASLLSYLHLEPIKISSSNPVKTSESYTNTSQPFFADIAVGNSQREMMEASTGMSQPLFADIAVGNSQPEIMEASTGMSQPLFADIAVGNSQPEMMEASTGMSQKDVSSIDCGIQTSQELPFQAVQQAVPPNVTTVQNEEASTSASKKPPIIFPRVRCQTSGPEIPAKVPRLSELDRGSVNLHPIYSSAVTFEFNDEESDKENDRSILRQRGTVRHPMLKESTYLHPSETQEPDVGNDENILRPSQARPSSSGSVLTSSRGPFIRVGLSKKLRIPKPLHPRTFDWE